MTRHPPHHVVRVLVALFTVLFGWWTAVCAELAAAAPGQVEAAYSYDRHSNAAALTHTAVERGPPTPCAWNTTYDSVGREPPGDSARPNGTTPAPTYDYDNSAQFLQLAAVEPLIKGPGQGPRAEFSVGWGAASDSAAKTADEAVDAYTHGYKYHPRIRQRGLEDPRAHNFPYSFDDVILRQKPTTQADGSLLYRKVGEINGKSGTFEIAVNPDTGVIFHRSWKP